MKFINLQCDLECGEYCSKEVKREIEEPLTVLRATTNLSEFTAAAYVGLLSKAEDQSEPTPLTDGVLDVSTLRVLEGLTLPKGTLVLSGFYTGFVPPSCMRGQRIRFHLTLACKKTAWTQIEQKNLYGAPTLLAFADKTRCEVGDSVEIAATNDGTFAFQPEYLACDDGPSWVIERALVGPHPVIEKATYFDRVNRSRGPIVSTRDWPPIQPGARVTVRVTCQREGRPPFRGVLYGCEIASWADK